jgi:hypothetical protein
LFERRSATEHKPVAVPETEICKPGRDPSRTPGFGVGGEARWRGIAKPDDRFGDSADG